jgi:hypothetical protein
MKGILHKLTQAALGTFLDRLTHSWSFLDRLIHSESFLDKLT